MITKTCTKKETEEHQLKGLEELPIKSIEEISQLEEPTDEQKEWVLGKLKSPEMCWKRWDEQ